MAMNRFGLIPLRAVLLALGLMLASAGTVTAGFKEGAEAFLAGRYDEAFSEFEPLAKDGNAQAQAELALLYLLGRGVDQDFATAEVWLRKAAAQGEPAAQMNLAVLLSEGAEGVPRRVNESIKLFETLILRGDFRANYRLAKLLEATGRLDDGAERWAALMMSAAEAGHVQAQYELGNALFQGSYDLKANGEHGFFWTHKAALAGDAAAQHNLGVYFLNGVFAKMDTSLAKGWFEKAAAQGWADSHVNLARLFSWDIYAEKNISKAIHHYDMAIALKSPIAGLELAQLFIDEKTSGVSEDEILGLVKTAADAGNAAAQNRLGELISLGLGSDNGPEDAVHWYRKAAKNGHAIAKHNLGIHYLTGSGVKANPQRAKELFRSAAKSGISRAHNDLGVVFLNEAVRGDPSDPKYRLAISHLETATQLGDEEAPYILGRIHSGIRGYPESIDLSTSYFRKAASRGNVRAQIYLSKLMAKKQANSDEIVIARAWGLVAREMLSARRNDAFRLPLPPMDGKLNAKSEERYFRQVLTRTLHNTRTRLEPHQIAEADDLAERLIDDLLSADGSVDGG